VRDHKSTAPSTFFFLVFPSGISSGFASITLPFILTRAGFSVAAAASIVALGVSANLWRFLWGPVADLTLTARRWYLIGLATTAGTLLLLGLIRLEPNAVGILGIVVFISQVASTLVMLPLGGLMAHTVADEAKGRAAGWYQAGNLGGNGVGGGAGVWIAAHFSKEASAGALAAAMLLCALALYFVSDVRLVTNETIAQRMRLLGRDVVAILRSAIPLFITVLVMTTLDGWVHDRFGSAWMLHTDALTGIVCIVIGLFVLQKIRAAGRATRSRPETIRP
jgi:PAT family beta-lactamase induction signal transducer AmpG